MWILTGTLLLVGATVSSAEQCTSVDCSSHKYKFASCPVPGAGVITSVNVAIKYSKSSCVYGSSYGSSRDSIWVNKGCRARFNVCYETGVHCKSQTCSSIRYKFATCTVSGATKVVRVHVVKRYSKSSCTFGHSYGKDRNTIWVNHGCRAMFDVCYV